MVECPSCGTEVTFAIKSWPVNFKKHDEECLQPAFLLGIFECPKCKSKFRSRVESPAKSAEVPKLQDLVEKVSSIQRGLIQTRKTLHEKLNSLETERGSLMLELGDLQKDADDRAEELESEICRLREEIKSIKKLLDSTEGESE